MVSCHKATGRGVKRLTRLTAERLEKFSRFLPSAGGKRPVWGAGTRRTRLRLYGL